MIGTTLLLGANPPDFFALLRWLSYALFLWLPLGLTIVAWRSRRHAAARARGLFVLAVLIAAVGAWAFGIEPRLLEVTRFEIRSHKLAAPVRVAVLADLQTDRVGVHERRALSAVMAAEPDLVLLTGDYLQVESGRFAAEAERLRSELTRAGLAAPLGVWAIGGDVDPAGWPELFAGLPITTLDRSTTFEAGDLTLTGLTPSDSRRGGLTIAASANFHIAFGHAPDFALGHPPVDLMIAGHTHGGQVRLPGIGPLLTLSRVPRSWAAGRTDLEPGRTLVVSRGVGMERGSAPRLRFLCRPEVVVIDLLPSDARLADVAVRPADGAAVARGSSGLARGPAALCCSGRRSTPQ